MSITQPEIQQALRISRAIEEHLEQIRSVNVPSQELYPMLEDRELVERDKEKGANFRLFLKKLQKENMLNLIPQCKATARSGGKFEYTFNRAGSSMPVRKPLDPSLKKAAEAETE